MKTVVAFVSFELIRVVLGGGSKHALDPKITRSTN